ncbi:hypothetical protein BGX29_006189 [Mortierella sp. GBA35]|nr:hypothetical protein BGX29_006189 [Mortierella sp. GBA35]
MESPYPTTMPPEILYPTTMPPAPPPPTRPSPPGGENPSGPLITPPPIPPSIPEEPPVTYATITTKDETKPTHGGGGGGNDSDPPKPTSTTTIIFSSDRDNSEPARTTATSSRNSNPQATPTKPGDLVRPSSSQPPSNGNGEITLQPGSPTSIRNTPSSSAPATISGSVISGPMTGVVFTFAFLGALVIGLVAGFLIAKYTRLGGSRARREQKDQLTEQLRLLTESIGQRNEYQNHPQQYRHQQQDRSFFLDRSYLHENKFAQAVASAPHQQAELMPLYMNRQYAYPTTTTAAGAGAAAGGMDRMDPQSVPDQNPYEDWNSVATPLMPGTPMVSVRSSIVPTSTAAAAATTTTAAAGAAVASSRDSFMANMSPNLLSPDIEIEGPKDEWASSGAMSMMSSRNGSVSDLNEFERRRPQIRIEGQGEESLFGDGMEVSAHNPHASIRVD